MKPGPGLWPGRQLASVSEASPPKGSPLLSSPNWMIQGSLQDITSTPTRTSHTYASSKEGRKWRTWKGLSLKLPSPSGSLNQYSSSWSSLPRRMMGICTVFDLCCWFSLSLIGPCPTCHSVPPCFIWDDASGILFIICLPQPSA